MSILTFERKKPVVLVSTEGMERAEWLEWRRKGLGGSDIAALFGLSKYKSVMQLYLEKTGDWQEDDEQSEAAYFGIMMEDFVAQEFMRRYEKDTGSPIKVQRRNAMFQHPDHPHLLANIDRRVVGMNAGLECKTASEYLKEQWVGDEEIPDAYMLQVQHYMGVMDYDEMWIAVLIGGNKFKYKYIKRDDEIIQMIAARAAAFWKLVENRTPPAVDGSDASTKVIKTLYPTSNGDGIHLPDEAILWVQQRDTWKIAEKDAAAKVQEAENHIKELLGHHEVGFLSDGGTITWKSQNEFDETAFAEAHPEIYARHLKKLDKDSLKAEIGQKEYKKHTKPGTRRLGYKPTPKV